jgi:integrase
MGCYGLRVSEIGLLQRTDADLKQGRITIHRMKGSLSGIYPLQPDVIKLLRSYLRGRTPEKRKFHGLKHSIATHLLDARGELRFVQDWVGHKNVQNTTKCAQMTNPHRDDDARKLFVDHRVV